MKKMSFLTVILLTVFAIGQSSAQTGSNQKGKSSDSSQIKPSEADTPRIGRGYGKTPASNTPGIGSSTATDSAMVLPNPGSEIPNTRPGNRTLRPRPGTTPLPDSDNMPAPADKKSTKNKDTGTTGTGSQTTTPKP